MLCGYSLVLPISLFPRVLTKRFKLTLLVTCNKQSEQLNKCSLLWLVWQPMIPALYFHTLVLVHNLGPGWLATIAVKFAHNWAGSGLICLCHCAMVEEDWAGTRLGHSLWAIVMLVVCACAQALRWRAERRRLRGHKSLVRHFPQFPSVHYGHPVIIMSTSHSHSFLFYFIFSVFSASDCPL